MLSRRASSATDANGMGFVPSASTTVPVTEAIAGLLRSSPLGLCAMRAEQLAKHRIAVAHMFKGLIVIAVCAV